MSAWQDPPVVDTRSASWSSGGNSQGGSAQGGAAVGGGGAGGVMAGACGKVTALSDDFEDGLDDDKWYPLGGTAETSSGELVVSTSAGDVLLLSRMHADLNDARLIVEAAPTEPGSGSALQVTNERDGFAQIAQSGGMLRWELSNEGGGGGFDDSRPYDPVAHRYWMVKVHDDDMYFEVSPDGDAWDVLVAVPAPVWTSAVEVRLVATDDGGASGAEARFDNLSVDTVSEWCPSDSFNADFGVVGQTFMSVAFDHTASSLGCDTVKTASHAELRVAGNSPGGCFWGTSTVFDLTDNAVEIEVENLPALDADLGLWFAVERPSGGEYYELGVAPDAVGVSYFYTSPESAVEPVPYLSGMNWWRIRHAGNSIFFEVSDGMTWTPIGEVPDSLIPLDAVRVLFGANTGLGTDEMRVFQIRRLN